MAKRSKEDRQRSREFLKERIAEKSTVCTEIARVSRDGMSRTIKVLITVEGDICNVSRQVADVLGWRYSESKNAVCVSGCGMDMGYHLVHSLSYALFSDAVPERAGYCLNHRWV